MAMNPRLLRPLATGFDPRRISNLLAWYDADDAATITGSPMVTQWADKSGNGYTLRQPTGNDGPSTGTRTIGGRNALDFDGSNDVLSLVPSSSSTPTYGIDIAATRQLSIFVVWATDNAGLSTQFGIGFHRSGFNANGGGAYFGKRSLNNNTETAAGRGDGNDQTERNFIRSFSDNTTAAHVYSTIIDGPGNALTTQKDGVNQTLTTRFGSATAGDFLTQGSGNHTLDIGNSRSSIDMPFSGSFWDGPVGEVIVYLRALSAAERAAVTRYLGGKWGIAVT